MDVCRRPPAASVISLFATSTSAAQRQHRQLLFFSCCGLVFLSLSYIFFSLFAVSYYVSSRRYIIPFPELHPSRVALPSFRLFPHHHKWESALRVWVVVDGITMM